MIYNDASSRNHAPNLAIKTAVMDSDDFGSDDFGDINDEELIAAATQAEQQAARPYQPPHHHQQQQQNQWGNGSGGGGTDNLFLPGDFDDSDDELPDAPAPSSNFGTQRPPASQGTLRQATLFGGRVPEGSQSSQNAPRQVHNYPLANTQEPPTHHKIDAEAAKTWVYPSNVSHRDYQYTIVHKALFSNLLVALPTGTQVQFVVLWLGD